MKRQFVFGTVMAAALTVGLGAQSTTPQSTSPQSGQSSTPSTQGSSSQSGSQDRASKRSDRGQTLTLTGCLQSGDSAMSGATGTTGGAPATGARTGAAGASSDNFVLADATQSSSDKSSTGANATGTAGTMGSATIPTRLNLKASGNSSANWSRYLNHKVEVKGTLEDTTGGAESKTTNPAGNPPSTNPSAPESSRSSAGVSSDMGATFHVTSIKEVAGTCSGSSIK